MYSSADDLRKHLPLSYSHDEDLERLKEIWSYGLKPTEAAKKQAERIGLNLYSPRESVYGPNDLFEKAWHWWYSQKEKADIAKELCDSGKTDFHRGGIAKERRPLTLDFTVDTKGMRENLENITKKIKEAVDQGRSTHEYDLKNSKVNLPKREMTLKPLPAPQIETKFKVGDKVIWLNDDEPGRVWEIDTVFSNVDCFKISTGSGVDAWESYSEKGSLRLAAAFLEEIPDTKFKPGDKVKYVVDFLIAHCKETVNLKGMEGLVLRVDKDEYRIDVNGRTFFATDEEIGLISRPQPKPEQRFYQMEFEDIAGVIVPDAEPGRNYF
jgi:hypothetical protein